MEHVLGNGLYMGGYGYGMSGYGYGMSSPFVRAGPDARRSEDEAAEALRDRYDRHLRSIAAVEGYHIHATDGEIGHVKDVLVEEADRSIHCLVVDTRNSWSGK